MPFLSTVYYSGLEGVGLSILLLLTKLSSSDIFLLFFFPLVSRFYTVAILLFSPITFQDNASFLPKEAISLHALNQNVSSAVTDGWIWVSCGKLMNNIYHLISRKLACNEAGAMIITSVNHDFKMMTIPPAPRIRDSQTMMYI